MNDEPPTSPTGYRLGDVTINLARRRVRRGDADIPLGKLSYKLLVALAQAAPGVLSQEDLVEQVWDGRYVNPPTIKQRFVMLRQALGDDANEPRYIRVVRGHGYSLVPNVETLYDQPAARPLRPALVTAVLLGALAIALAFLAREESAPPDEAPSIAVLPFDSLSPEPDHSFFATGLHEEVIDRLTRIDGLRVLSRSSVQHVAKSAATLRDIARELNVDAVMEGSVDYRNGIVRIRAQLVDPESGTQLWTNTYERDFADIFEIQREIATSVAGAMGVKLGVRSSNAFHGAGTTDIAAYEAFLAGLHALGQVRGRDRAIAFFERATELDPDYAAAWASLGFAIAAESFYSASERVPAILDQAMPPLLRAVELDPQSSRAAAILGFVRYAGFDWIGAEKDYARAMDLHTSRDLLAQHAAMLMRAGRVAAARSEFSTADSIERSFEPPGPLRAQVEIAQGRYADARALASKVDVPILRQRLLLNIALNEGDPESIRQAMSDLMAVESISSPLFAPLLRSFDSREAAIAIIRAVHDDTETRWPAKQHDIGLLAAYLGDPSLALVSIAAEARLSTVRIWALWYPVMSDVRRLPEFKELVRSLELDSYWRAYGWADSCAPLGEGDFACF